MMRTSDYRKQANCHVVVVGAGVVGMCTAYSLAKQGIKVNVIDKNAIASGSSGRSVGVVGSQLTDYLDILLRKWSIDFFACMEDEGLQFNHIGYLRLARTAQQMTWFERSVEMQKAFGLRSEVCSLAQLNRLVPHMSVQGLAGAIFGPDNGFIDPHQMCMLLASYIREQGGEVMQFNAIQGVDVDSSQITVSTQKGRLQCDYVINAAGAWAPKVAAMMGQTLHVYGERHEAVNIHLAQPLDYVMPMIMDLVNGEGTGLNLRHERPGELVAEIHANTGAVVDDPDDYNELCNEESKVRLAELVMERFPDLPGPGLGHGWAGLYPMTRDGHPFVGCLSVEEPRLITAAGAGGYGIQLSPVMGMIAADWVVHGYPKTIPEAQQLAPDQSRNQPL